MSEPPIVTPKHRVCHSRRHARDLTAGRLDVSKTGCIYIRLDGVEAVAVPFVSELLTAWPLAVPIGANEDVQATWDLVQERRHA